MSSATWAALDFGRMSYNELEEVVLAVETEIRDLALDARGEMRDDVSPAEDHDFRELVRLRDLAKSHQRTIAQYTLGTRTSRGAGRGSVERAFGGTLTGRTRFGDSAPEDALNMSGAEARDMALRGLESRGRDLAPDQQDQVDGLLRSVISEDNPNTDGGYIAKRILITESDAYRNAWTQLVTRPAPHLLTPEEVTAVRALEALDRSEYRGMNEGTTTAGGFGIPVFIDPSIIMTSQGSGNPFLSIARQAQVTSNAWKGVSSAGVSWSFDAESATVSDDSPTLAQPTVTVYMARGFIPFSIEVSQDYPSFAQEMAQLLGEGYDELLVNKFTQGSGTAEPQGVLTAISASAGCRVSIQTSGTAFGPDDPYRLWKQVPQRFRRRASWMMSLDVNNKLRQIATANVFHAYTANLPAEWADVLFGKRVYESPYMPDTTTSTTANTGLALAGDFQQYLVARRAGMSVELVNHLVDTTSNRPTAERGWFAYGRIGGGVLQTSGFRLLVNTG